MSKCYFFIPWIFSLLLHSDFRCGPRFEFGEHSTNGPEVPVYSGMTGAQAARRMLDANGLYDVPVEAVPGTLSDHYDPIARVVRLSEPVYYQSSISAVSVACHEVGHAIQHKVHYPMLVARHHMFPVVNFASGVAPFLILAGFFFQQIPWLARSWYYLFRSSRCLSTSHTAS